MTPPAPVDVGGAGCKIVDLLGDETAIKRVTRGVDLALPRAAGCFRFGENASVNGGDPGRSVQCPRFRRLTAGQPHLGRTWPFRSEELCQWQKRHGYARKYRKAVLRVGDRRSQYLIDRHRAVVAQEQH